MLREQKMLKSFWDLYTTTKYMFTQEGSMSKFAILSTFNDPDSAIGDFNYDRYEERMTKIALELKNAFAEREKLDLDEFE